MDVFQLWGKIAIDNAQANSAIDGTTDKAEQSSNSMGKAFQKIGSAVAAYFAADKIIDFGKACVSAAAEVSAEVSAFEQIMGDYADEASGKVEKIAEATGMVDSRLTPYMTSLTAKFKGLGYDIGDATDMATTGLTIAADAAAFWDKSLDDAMGSLNSFVNGSYEGGEAIGLFANETTLATWAAQSLNLEWADLTEKEKQFARLEFAKAMQKASGATGQAAKESSQYANVQANLNEKWRQFKAEIGEPILQNMVIPGMQMLSDVVDFASENLDDITIAALTLAGAMAGKLAGQAIVSVVAGFQTAQVQLALYAASAGAASVSQGVLNGQFTIGEVVVGVLTGKISLATAAQYAWNTAMNANPIGIVIALVSALAIAVNKSRKHVNDLADGYVKQAGSAAECAKNLEELKARYAELTGGQRNPNKWAVENRTEIVALGKAIEETEAQLYLLTDAETAAAISSGELSAQTLADADAIQSAAETYAASAQAIMEEYYDTYNSIYGKLYNAAGMFTEVATAMEIKYSDMMKTLDQNIQFQESFNQNLDFVKETAAGAGVNIDSFVAALSEMDKSQAAGILAAVRTEIESTATDADSTSETLKNLMLEVSRYGDANAEGADSMAQTITNVQQKMNEELETYTAAVQDLDQAAEAIEAGKNTMDGLLSGITSGTPGVLSAVDSLASQMKSRLQTSFSDFVLNIQTLVTAKSNNIPGLAVGLERVPYDNYLAYLHKDEAVLTATEARAWRAGKAAASSPGTANSEDDGNTRTGHSVTVIQYIQAVAQTPVEFAAATEAYLTQARWSV